VVHIPSAIYVAVHVLQSMSYDVRQIAPITSAAGAIWLKFIAPYNGEFGFAERWSLSALMQ